MDPRETPRRPGDDPAAPDRPPAARWTQSLARFFQVEAAGGVALLIGTAAALALANSPWSAAFAGFWQTRVGLTAGGFELNKPLLLWINDGLMTVFFFVVGLEIKREVVAGELRDLRKAALPVVAAVGGMVVPAAVYFALQRGQPGERGWGVPMATDIAFVVGFLALLGPRVPAGLKIALLSLAIVDDIGAVLVIAAFYSTGVSLTALGLAGLGLAATVVLRCLGVRRVAVYAVVGAAVWLAFLKSGVHPTVAGVLLGLLTPASAVPGEAVSPLERLEASLHPWVAFLIMPVFALANAGVAIEPAALGHPVALAVAAGLALGKPLGVVLFSWLAVRAGLARLPEGVTWKVLLGGGCLAGIGFTMSLFIAGLALDGPLLDAAKIGTLAGSVLSVALGLGLLLAWLPGRAEDVPLAGAEDARTPPRPEAG